MLFRHHGLLSNWLCRFLYVFLRIHIGNTQAVRYDGIGAATTAYVIKARGLSIADNISGDQEVCIEAKVIDDLQLLLYPCFCLLIFPVAVGEAIHSEFFQQVPVIFPRVAESLFGFVGIEIHRDVPGGFSIIVKG